MIVVDTDVVAELTRPFPSRSVLQWFDDAEEGELFITAMTAAELLEVVARAPRGRRRDQVGEEITNTVEVDFAERVLPFDVAAARAYSVVRANRVSADLPIAVVDAQTAAICRAHGATLATHRPDDFERTGVKTTDPFLTRVGAAPTVRLALD